MKAAPGNALRFASPTVNVGKSERAILARSSISHNLSREISWFFSGSSTRKPRRMRVMCMK